MTFKNLALMALGLVMTLGSAQAEQKVVFRGYELHYIVLNSTELAPEIAQQYNLQRSGRLALVNFSVLKQQPNGVAEAVEAEVSMNVRNLLGQVKPVELTTVREQDAIYHLGQVRFDDREVLWFDVDVEIPGQPLFEHSFSQEMWEDK